jgi:glucan biosynthesis protein C
LEVSALPSDRPPPSIDVPREETGNRLVFVDVLRVALILLVIAHHAGQAYGPTGGEWPVDDPANSAWLGPFFAVNAAFFMGLMFLLAGYFVPRSFDRKGTGRFLKDRSMRIGVPLAFFVLLVQMPLVYLNEEPRLSFSAFIQSLYDSGLQNAYIHLWFLGHLLLYSVAYVAWRLIADRRSNRSPRTWAVPSHAAIIGFVVVLALITWVVRWWFPIDEWIPLFNILATEPAHLPQYVILFTLGVLAYRGDWLRQLLTSTGMIWLGIGLVAAGALYAVNLGAPDVWNDIVELGGRNRQSLLYSTWEAVICAGLSVGLIVLFRRVFRRTNRFFATLAVASLAAYILHWLIVVGIQSAIVDIDLPALAKFALVTAVGATLTLGLAYLFLKVPGVRVILGSAPKKTAKTPHHDAPT